jgi:hypothetical protein
MTKLKELQKFGIFERLIIFYDKIVNMILLKSTMVLVKILRGFLKFRMSKIEQKEQN